MVASLIASHDRLNFAIFLATVVHATLIFGMGFSAQHNNTRAPSLEVTLAVHNAEQAPEKADYLAQANQEGSGALAEKALLSTTEIAEYFDNDVREIQTETPSSPHQPDRVEHRLVTTIEHSNSQNPFSQMDPTETAEDQPEESALSLVQQSLEIASLEAQLREKRQAYAKRPRKRTLTELSTKASVDAAYLDAWRRKIESVGNAHYSALDIGNLTGNLRMLVAVNANGTINNVKILESSGTPKLDEAALQVVRLSAPFEAFPKPVQETTDVLEIIRTWRFEKGNYLSSTHQR